MSIREQAHDLAPYVIRLREDFHRHPELSMRETRTTQRIAEELDGMGVPYRRMDPTGVLAEIKGACDGACVMLRADIDALPVSEEADVPFKSETPGLMHACGHDAHAAMLLGAAKLLWGMRDELPGTVRLLFQPGEEDARGAKAMVAQGVLDGVDAAFGLHVGAMMPVGQVAIGHGASTASGDRWMLKVHGKAGHGAFPNECVDATVCAAAIVSSLQTVVSREAHPDQPVVVTVGTFNSGTEFNVVSGEAVLTGTCRSFDYDVHHGLPKMMERIIKGTCEAYRCSYEFEYIMLNESLVNDERIAAFAQAAAEKVVEDPASQVVPDVRRMASEDFAEYAQHRPSAFVQLGTGGEYPHHSGRFWLDESAFEVGVAMHAQCAVDYLAAAAEGRA